jgi:hypothetical protein
MVDICAKSKDEIKRQMETAFDDFPKKKRSFMLTIDGPTLVNIMSDKIL